MNANPSLSRFRFITFTATLAGVLAASAAEPDKAKSERPAPGRERREGQMRVVTTVQGAPGQPGQPQVQIFQAPAGQPGQPMQIWGGGGGGGWGGGLDEDQRQLVRDAMQPSQSDIQKLEEELRDAQKALMKALLAETYDDKVVEAKADTVARLQTKIYVLRGKAYSTIAPTLKQEQREYMENFGFFMLQNNWALGGPVVNMRMGGPGGGGAPGVLVAPGGGPGAAPERIRGGAPPPPPRVNPR